MLSCAVVMASYNGGKYIEEQLKSIIKQTQKPDRIIISDDCSTDDTVEKASHILKNANIEYLILESKENQGVNKNFEKAVRQVKEDIILFSDQDDIWHQNKIEKIKECFKKHNCSLVFSDANLFGEKGVYKKTLFEVLKFTAGAIQGEQVDRNSFLSKIIFQPVVAGMSMAIKRDCLCDALPFSQYSMYDEWLCWNYIKRGICVMNTPLVDYRQHSNNVVAGNKRFSFGHILKKSKLNRMNLEKELLKWEEIHRLDEKEKIFDIENREKFEKKREVLEERLDVLKSEEFFLRRIKRMVHICREHDLTYYRVRARAKDLNYIIYSTFFRYYKLGM